MALPIAPIETHWLYLRRKPANHRYLLMASFRTVSREATGARAARQRVKAKFVNLGAAAELVGNADFETYSEGHPYAETFVIQEGAEGG